MRKIRECYKIELTHKIKAKLLKDGIREFCFKEKAQNSAVLKLCQCRDIRSIKNVFFM